MKVLFFLVKVSQTCVNSQMLMLRCSNPVRSSGSEPSPNGSPDPGRGSSLPEKVALFPSLKHEVLGAWRHRPSVMSQVAGLPSKPPERRPAARRSRTLDLDSWTGHLFFHGIFKMTKSFKVILKQTKTLKNLWTSSQF